MIDPKPKRNLVNWNAVLDRISDSPGIGTEALYIFALSTSDTLRGFRAAFDDTLQYWTETNQIVKYEQGWRIGCRKDFDYNNILNVVGFEL